MRASNKLLNQIQLIGIPPRLLSSEAKTLPEKFLDDSYVSASTTQAGIHEFKSDNPSIDAHSGQLTDADWLFIANLLLLTLCENAQGIAYRNLGRRVGQINTIIKSAERGIRDTNRIGLGMAATAHPNTDPNHVAHISVTAGVFCFLGGLVYAALIHHNHQDTLQQHQTIDQNYQLASLLSNVIEITQQAEPAAAAIANPIVDNSTTTELPLVTTIRQASTTDFAVLRDTIHREESRRIDTQRLLLHSLEASVSGSYLGFSFWQIAQFVSAVAPQVTPNPLAFAITGVVLTMCLTAQKICELRLLNLRKQHSILQCDIGVDLLELASIDHQILQAKQTPEANTDSPPDVNPTVEISTTLLTSLQKRRQEVQKRLQNNKNKLIQVNKQLTSWTKYASNVVNVIRTVTSVIKNDLVSLTALLAFPTIKIIMGATVLAALGGPWGLAFTIVALAGLTGMMLYRKYKKHKLKTALHEKDSARGVEFASLTEAKPALPAATAEVPATIAVAPTPTAAITIPTSQNPQGFYNTQRRLSASSVIDNYEPIPTAPEFLPHVTAPTYGN